MRVLLALLLLVPAGPLSPLADSSEGDPRPTRWVVEAQPPDPLPAGEGTVLEVRLHREAAGNDAPGPGQAEVRLQAPPTSGCRPDEQTVSLDPTTGRGQARINCHPEHPGVFPLRVMADSPSSRAGTWNASLVVEPDRLSGDLELGQPSGYRVPLDVTLEPQHLDSARVNLTVDAELRNGSLGLETGLGSVRADGNPVSRTWVARHGPGTYEFNLHAEGPAVEAWSRSAQLRVESPDTSPRLELNATVEPGETDVSLSDDTVNENGKTKRPGDRLITRLTTTRADAINVTVLRAAGNDTVRLNTSTVEVDDSGQAEHVFEQEPLPAGPLWVQASAGQASVARTARIQDLEASATNQGPDSLLADGRAWRGTLRLEDPNFGSTPADPGPVFGLPNVSWTVYRGTSTAGGFDVRLGPFEGGSEGRAATARIPWPSGLGNVSVGPGWARLPVAITPPPDVEPGTYRLSVYAPDGDRIGGASFELSAPPAPSLEIGDLEPGTPLAVNLTVENPVENVTTNLTLSAGGDTLSTASVNASGRARLDVPAPLEAGTPIQVTARSDWPGRPSTRTPDETIEREVPDLPPRVRAHAALDGHPVRSPVPAHPAANHTLEVAYTAADPNTGPVNATVNVTGPEGPTEWPIETSDGLARIEVPQQAPAGRYQVNLTAESAGSTGTATVPVDRLRTVRLGLEGPDAIHLPAGSNRSLNLTISNRGSLSIGSATLLVETQLDLEASVEHGDDRKRAGRPIPVELPPGGARDVQLHLEAHGSGQGRVNVTVAGVAP